MLLKIVRFRGALYHLALSPEVRELLKKREQMLGLLSSLGVVSTEEELTVKYQKSRKDSKMEDVVPFLPLQDGRPFTQLVYEMVNRAAETGTGETPAFYDNSADELSAGIQDALTGKLMPTLKQIRQIFDELKQHPAVLHPKDFLREEKPPATPRRPAPHKPTPQEREHTLELQEEFMERHRASAVPRTVTFKGALYRLADDHAEMYLALKALVIGQPGDKSHHNLRATSRRLRENLFRFRTSYQEDVLVASERLAQELLTLSEGVAEQLRKVMAEEQTLRKDMVDSQTSDLVDKEHKYKKELIVRFFDLKRHGFIDDAYLNKRSQPPDLDPRTLTIQELEQLLGSAIEAEKKAVDRAYQRARDTGKPVKELLPTRKVWKEIEKPPEQPKPPKVKAPDVPVVPRAVRRRSRLPYFAP